jgi:tellurite resistance protein
MKTGIKINKSEKENLYHVMRTSKNIETKKKAHIIILISNELNVERVASVFEIGKNEVKQIIDDWKKRKFSLFF